MKYFSILYLTHTLLYCVGALMSYTYDFTFITSTCGVAEGTSYQTSMSSLVKTGAMWVYLICGALSFIVAGASIYFSRGFLPPELGKLTRFQGILGAIERLSWFLLRIMSYVLFIILLVFAYQGFFPPDCLKGSSGATSLSVMVIVALFVWTL